MEISEKGLLHFYQQPSSLIGNQTNHRTNNFFKVLFNSCCESDYECICIVINGKIRSVPLNILSSVDGSNSKTIFVHRSTIIDSLFIVAAIFSGF